MKQEPRHRDRVEKVLHIIEDYYEDHDDIGDAVTNLLEDLRHYCYANNLDPKEMSRRSLDYFRQDIAQEFDIDANPVIEPVPSNGAFTVYLMTAIKVWEHVKAPTRAEAIAMCNPPDECDLEQPLAYIVKREK